MDGGVTAAPRRQAVLTILLLFGFALVPLLVRLWQLPQRISANYNEGWNARHAVALLRELPLYPSDGAWFFNNYPPLSFHVVAALAPLAGDAIIAGRILALLGLLATALFVGLAAARLGSRMAGWLAAGLLLAAQGWLAPGYVAMNDPQWFGHALAAAGLLLVVRHATGAPSSIGLVVAAVLMVLSGLVKHNLLALPLGCALWLLWHDRRGFVVFALTALATAAVLLGGFLLLHGWDLLTQVLGHRRVWSREAFLRGLIAFAFIMPPAAAGLPAALAAWRERALRLPVLCALLGSAVALATAAGEGTSLNITFEALIACAILAGIALARGPVPLQVAAILVAGLLAYRIERQFLSPPGGPPPEALAATVPRADMPALLDTLSRLPGPVLCESLAVCHWAGHVLQVDPFNLRQAMRVQPGYADAMWQALEQRRFGAVLLQQQPWEWFGAGSRGAAALDAGYQPVAAGAGFVLFAPRP
jgi:hypothetical protein